MNSPSQRSSFQPEEPIQEPAETGWDEQSLAPVAPDAPPLRADQFDRADQYDPVWVAESETQQREALTQQDLDRLEKIITSDHFRIRQQRTPSYLPPPPPPPLSRKRGGLRWTVGTFAVLVLASSLVALNTTGKLPIPDGWSDGFNDQKSRISSLLSSTSDVKSAVENANAAANPTAGAPAQPAPRLVVKGASAENTEEILLGVGVEGSASGVNAVVSGLAQGTTLSRGKPWGATGWILPASDLDATYLRPPSGFSGTMEYTVALQMPDNAVLDRQSMRLEWTSPDVQSPAAPPAAPKAPEQSATHSPVQAPAQAPAPAQPTQQTRVLEQQEIDLMVKRGEELLGTGDIASARLLLRRAAEARDARAALALAASYDPIALKRLGVYGAKADVTVARDWYEKAKIYGSREAPQRLELLASQYR